MVTGYFVKKAEIWLCSIGIVLGLTCIQQELYPKKAEAALLDTISILMENSGDHTNEGHPNGDNQVKSAPSDHTDVAGTSPAPSSALSFGSLKNVLGADLLPHLHVKTPPVTVDTPLADVKVPSAKLQVSKDKTLNTSVIYLQSRLTRLLRV